MTPYEEHLTRAVFDRVAGRRLPKKKIEEVVESIKLFSSQLEAYPDLKKELERGKKSDV